LIYEGIPVKKISPRLDTGHTEECLNQYAYALKLVHTISHRLELPYTTLLLFDLHRKNRAALLKKRRLLEKAIFQIFSEHLLAADNEEGCPYPRHPA